jgi:hypothetical protein
MHTHTCTKPGMEAHFCNTSSWELSQRIATSRAWEMSETQKDKYCIFLQIWNLGPRKKKARCCCCRKRRGKQSHQDHFHRKQGVYYDRGLRGDNFSKPWALICVSGAGLNTYSLSPNPLQNVVMVTGNTAELAGSLQLCRTGRKLLVYSEWRNQSEYLTQ